MSDANIQRGQDTFQKSIEGELLGMSNESSTCLKMLLEHFKESVGIMPMNGLYAAKRLATACIEVAKSPFNSDEENIDAVKQNYGGEVVSKPSFRLSNDESIKNRGTSVEGYAESGNQLHDDETKKLGSLIDSGVSKRLTEVFQIESEDGEIHDVDVEVIDLIDDAASLGELSVEGMRAIGLVDSRFDTTKNSVSSEIITSANQLIKEEGQNWRVDEDGFLIILCPFCFDKGKVYPMGENMFSCFECDAEFEFHHNLSDTQSDSGGIILH